MTDIQTLRDDIEYVKTLANEGRGGPAGGLFGFCSSMIWTIAALVMWAEIAGLFRLPELFHYRAFLVAIVVQILFSAAALPHLKRTEAPSRDARSISAVRAGFGVTINMLMFSLFLGWWMRDVSITWNQIMPAAIAMYGGAWFVCGQLTGARWMKVVSVGCAIGVAAMAVIPRSGADIMLTYAACIFLFGACPCLYMTRVNAKARG